MVIKPNLNNGGITMFCQKCGTQSLEGTTFCQKCGTKLAVNEATQQITESPTPSVTPESTMPSYSQASATPVATVTQTSDDYFLQSGTQSNNDILRTLIGKNSDYYIEQFAKIDSGKKSFNKCALFFAPILLLYRKQFSYFSKMLLPVYALLIIQFLLTGYATATFSFELMSVVPITSVIIGAYALITAIICGKGFNKRYKASLQKAIAENNLTSTNIIAKKFKPSALIPILFVIVYSSLMVICNLVINTMMENYWLG